MFWLPKVMLFLICQASLFHWIIFNYQVRDCLGSKYPSMNELRFSRFEGSESVDKSVGSSAAGHSIKNHASASQRKEVLGQDSWKDVYGKKTWWRLNPVHPQCCWSQTAVYDQSSKKSNRNFFFFFFLVMAFGIYLSTKKKGCWPHPHAQSSLKAT